MTTKFKDYKDTSGSMKAHEYRNIKLVEIDGLMRVLDKNGNVMPMSLGLTAKRTYRKNRIGAD